MSTCSICLEDNPDFELPLCGHRFHSDCIQQWLLIKPECPMCRKICTKTFSYYYKYKIIKKGELTIDQNSITLKQKRFLKGSCIPMTKIINFISIKRIEFNQNYFSVYYYNNNNIIKLKKIYLVSPRAVFNLCRYHFYNNRELGL